MGRNVYVFAMWMKCVCPYHADEMCMSFVLLMKNVCPCHADEKCMSLPCWWNVYVLAMPMKCVCPCYADEMKFQHLTEWTSCLFPLTSVTGLGHLTQHGVKLNNVRLHRYNMQTVRQHWDAASLCPLTLPLFHLFVPTLKIVVLKTTRMSAVHCRSYDRVCMMDRDE